MSGHQLYVCQPPEYDKRGNPTGHAQQTIKHVSWALDREDAKRKAQLWLGGDKEQYIVTPITNPGDRVKLDITLNV